MTKILLVFLIIGELFVTIGKAISCLFQPKAKSKAVTSISDSWYGICEKCGRKDGLHRFEGKKYCAMCRARLTTEKKLKAKKNDKNES
ncbi:MAG: hypothetical protein ACOX72_06365 [Sedimentibacter sp.]|jgi:hypothetical protein